MSRPRRNSHELARALRPRERWTPAIRTPVARLDPSGEWGKELDEHTPSYPIRVNGAFYDRDARRVRA